MTSRSQIPVAVPRQRPALFFVDNVGFDINIFQSPAYQNFYKSILSGDRTRRRKLSGMSTKKQKLFQASAWNFLFF